MGIPRDPVVRQRMPVGIICGRVATTPGIIGIIDTAAGALHAAPAGIHSRCFLRIWALARMADHWNGSTIQKVTFQKIANGQHQKNKLTIVVTKCGAIYKMKIFAPHIDRCPLCMYRFLTNAISCGQQTFLAQLRSESLVDLLHFYLSVFYDLLVLEIPPLDAYFEYAIKERIRSYKCIIIVEQGIIQVHNSDYKDRS
jgi:hypothetical protein